MRVTRDGTRFLDPRGNAIPAADPRVETWRRAAMPPAYTHTCFAEQPDPSGLLATGVDAAGRTQYRYHPDGVAEKARQRRCKLRRRMPSAQERLDKHLREAARRTRVRPEDAAVDLIGTCGFRLGSDASEATTGAVGITTLRGEHVTPGDAMRIEFTGKSKQHNVCTVPAGSVAGTYLRQQADALQRRPAARAFPDLTPADVNAHIRGVARDTHVTSKDIRTWQANTMFIDAMRTHGRGVSSTAAKRTRQRAVRGALEDVSRHLHNTVSVLRKSYVFPELLDAALQDPSAPLRMPGPC